MVFLSLFLFLFLFLFLYRLRQVGQGRTPFKMHYILYNVISYHMKNGILTSSSVRISSCGRFSGYHAQLCFRFSNLPESFLKRSRRTGQSILQKSAHARTLSSRSHTPDVTHAFASATSSVAHPRGIDQIERTMIDYGYEM